MNTVSHYDERWAVVIQDNDDAFFAAKHCWANATRDEPTIRTFRTRALCVEAIRRMALKRKVAKPIRVWIEMTAMKRIPEHS